MLFRSRWGHVLALALLGFAVICSTAQAQIIFSSPKQVSNNTAFGTFTPQVAVDSSGNIYVVWEDDASSHTILFSLSTDGGVTFSPPMGISNPNGDSFNPRIFVDSHDINNVNVNIVWLDDASGPTDVFFNRSTDGGKTFSPTPVNLSNGPTSSSFTSNPQVAADSAGNIFVVWENDSGMLGILCSRLLVGGTNFLGPVFVSQNAGGSTGPQMAVDASGNINIVWEDDNFPASDISFARSQDHCATFSTPKSLSHNVGNSSSAQIALDLAGNINVVWQNNSPGNSDIFYTRSTDGGQNFLPLASLVNVSASPALSSGNPQIAIDPGGNINVIWTESVSSSSTTNIFFARSSDAGKSFSSPTINVSNNTDASTNPALAVDSGGNINLVWEDTTGNHDIFFSRSSDAGSTFLTPMNLSGKPGLSSVPQIVADKKGSLNVVWQDKASGIFQILFSRFTNAVVNHPPSADAGPDQTVQAIGQNGVSVTLDGSKSSDPDGDTLTYSWTDQNNTVVGITAVVQLNLLPGNYTFTLTVTDPGNLSSSATTHVTVNPPVNHPPVANAGASQTLGCTGQNGTAITLDGSKSSDPDGDTLTFVWRDASGKIVGTTAVAKLTLPSGIYTFTLTVTDPGGLSSSASTQVSIQDTAAPQLSVSLSPNSLQPPNHKLIPIYATVSASDACSANVAVTLVSIVSNEPDNGTGDGDQPFDIQAIGGGPVPFGTDVRSFLLRSERSGGGNGRIYTVTYSATDAAGNSTSAVAYVVVDATLPDPPSSTQGGTGTGTGHGHDNRDRNRDKDHDKDKGHKDKNHDKDRSDKDHDNDRKGDH